MKHRFIRSAYLDRPARRALCDLASADDAFILAVDRWRLQRQLNDGLHQALWRADHAEAAIPLWPGVELSLAVAKRLAGHHQHWSFQRVSAGERHRALEEARAGVQQRYLHLACDMRVAGSHGDREGLMSAIEINRTGRAVCILTSQRLPARRPLGAGRG